MGWVEGEGEGGKLLQASWVGGGKVDGGEKRAEVDNAAWGGWRWRGSG